MLIYRTPVISLFWTFKNKLQLLFQATSYLNIVQWNTKKKQKQKKILQCIKTDTHTKTNFFAAFLMQIPPHNLMPETADDASWLHVLRVLVVQVQMKRPKFPTFLCKRTDSIPEASNACISFQILSNSTRCRFHSYLLGRKTKVPWS